MKSDFSLIIRRGWSKRCPQCGRGRMIAGWYTLHETCPDCGLQFINQGNTWGFVYVSTAFLTGVIILAMLLIKPANTWLGVAGVTIAAILLILGTLPRRKALAIAIDYFVELKWDNFGRYKLRRGDSQERCSNNAG